MRCFVEEIFFFKMIYIFMVKFLNINDDNVLVVK